ncbi:MAG TPA: hypothetical protein PKC76_09650 [Saprospiraceae bacterium]|nr:hypothetical protein [Saprospiraceae bacterium]HMP24385.1 hypothetical protein [Saprospiraceae bacterium]
MPTYKEFYTQFGLKENPFASFTTENEGQRFSKTFIKPNDYETILENFSQKNSILLTGDRGTGKTALIKDFISKIDGNNSIIVHIIDFSSLKQDYELKDFYKFVIVNLSVSLFAALADKQSRVTKLNKEEKLLLCYLLKNFVPQISKRQLREQIEKVQIAWWKRTYKKVENVVRGIFNYGATTGGAFIDDYIARHFTGLPPLSDSVKIKDYFPELPINIEEEFIDQEASYNLMLRIISLAKHLDFERILVVFDRVDEDSRFMNDAELISEFIVKILTDNKFLLEPDLQVVFSTWVTPFNYIKDQVRTQKHYCPTLNWTDSDLIKALNKRLFAYSDDTVSDYKILFADTVTEDEIIQVFQLANNNPRDLWHIFNALFKTQYEFDANSNKITSAAIPKALTQFVTTFNYYEYYPKKSNARANSMDIYSYANHLLKLESETFTKNQLNDRAQTGSSTNNYVVSMERIGLIGVYNQTGGVVYYKIKDQKVIYALKNGLEIKRD